ncbi:MAG: hypothetical protein MI784_17375 [Cytophagales bacterium]|nr:hypothetical protein [Cytophagales bacterium]
MKKAALILLLLAGTQTLFGQIKPKLIKQIKGLDSSCEELRPVMSWDGRYLFFSRTLCKGQRSQEIWGVDFADSIGKRTMKLVGGLNNNENNAVVGASDSGSEIFVMDVYPADRFGRSKGIRRARLNENGAWELGERLMDFKEILSKKRLRGYVGAFAHSSAKAVLLTLPNKSNQLDLYVTYKDEVGVWSSPKNLGPHINTAGNEFAAFVSDDGRMLYFSSDGHSGAEGVDIYKCRRLGNWEEWSVPLNMGAPYNTEHFDGYYFSRGNSEFLVSNRNGRMSDIFQVFEKSFQKGNQELPDSAGYNETAKRTDLEPITIYFNANDRSLSEEHLAELSSHIIGADPSAFAVYVVGYADNAANEVLNTALSTARAEWVAGFLKSKGFVVRQVYGKGSYDRSRTHVQLNNRVEVSFHFL